MSEGPSGGSTPAPESAPALPEPSQQIPSTTTSSSSEQISESTTRLTKFAQPKMSKALSTSTKR